MFPVLRVVATMAVLAGSSHVYAVLVLLPPPVGPYRLAFVTSTGTAATATNIATYNTFVTTAANSEPALMSLGATWSVIGATSAVSAIANTMTDPSPAGATGVPIYRLDGVKIADHYDDLWDGSLLASISITEMGTDPQFSAIVWTGSAALPGFGVQSLGSPAPVAGLDSLTSTGWIQFGTSSPNTELRPVYALSSVLVAVPEPSAFLCVGLIGGLVGLGSLSWNGWRSGVKKRIARQRS